MKKPPAETAQRELSDRQLATIRGGVDHARTKRENIVFSSVSNVA